MPVPVENSLNCIKLTMIDGFVLVKSHIQKDPNFFKEH
jgi:hypothetical protein